MKKITIKTLTNLNACPEAIKFASKDKRMVNGVTSSVFLKSIPQGDWLIWWLWESKQATIEQVILLGCVAGRRSLRFSRTEDLKILTAAFDSAEAVAMDNTEANREVARSAYSAVRSASYSAACSAAYAASSAAVRSAVYSAASAARSAEYASSAAGSAAAYSAEHLEGSASSEASFAEYFAERSAEHLACADAIRKCMGTKKYKGIGYEKNNN